MSITVIQYKSDLKNDWDRFVDDAKNATFLHKRDFMEYHKDTFNDFSLMFYFHDELVGLLPACIEEKFVYSHKGLTYGGLLVLNNCKFSLFKNIFSSLMVFLKQHNIQKLIIKTLPNIFCKTSNDEISFLHQQYQAEVTYQLGSVIYPNNEKIISKSIIRNSKNAQKNGIVIKKSENIETFWNDLLIPRLQNRYNKNPIHSLDEINKLKYRFPNNISLVAAFLDDKMIAGTLLFINDFFVKSQYIASIESFNKLGGLDLLHYQIILNLENKKFDFGTSMENSFTENSSLLAWKEQFGARSLAFTTYTFTI